MLAINLTLEYFCIYLNKILFHRTSRDILIKVKFLIHYITEPSQVLYEKLISIFWGEQIASYYLRKKINCTDFFIFFL